MSVVTVKLADTLLIRSLLGLGPDASLKGAWMDLLGPNSFAVSLRVDMPDAPAGADQAVLTYDGPPPKLTGITWLRDGKPIDPPEA